jgi:transcription elongation factor GreA
MGKEKLHDKIKGDPAWALKTIIKSFGNNPCDIKRIKAELVPSVLTAGEWSSWNTKAHAILKSDPSFGVSPDNINVFTVRDRALSKEEKLYNEFKAEKKFFNRLSLIREFVAEIKDIEPDSEHFNEMLVYFMSFLKQKTHINYEYVSSYLLLKDLAGTYSFIAEKLKLNFTAMFEKIKDLTGLFKSIKDEKIQKDFLEQIKLFIPEWKDIYVKLFPYALQGMIIESLREEGDDSKIISLIRGCFENYRDSREAIVWLYKEFKDDPVFAKAGVSAEKILIALVHLLELTYREIDNNRYTTENKRLNRQVYTILFKKNLLDAYIDNADRGSIVRIYTLIDDVRDLDPVDKLKLKNRILVKFPDFKFFGAMEKDVVSRTLTVTSAKFNEKQRQLERIMNEEIPANSKEIAFALSLGDLRENAEYKAAKEKQEILNSTVSKLKNEIERSQLFDPSTINTARVSFGTAVTLENETAKRDDVYTLLGPWESDPDNNIISYLSPFGASVMNKRVGEKFDFEINGEKITYTVKEITAAKF